jgi:endo-1,4-beta-xylanase
MLEDNSKVITNVTFWGLKDDLSWLNTFFGIRNDFPLLFDSAFTAKYAYWGVVAPEILRELI